MPAIELSTASEAQKSSLRTALGISSTVETQTAIAQQAAATLNATPAKIASTMQYAENGFVFFGDSRTSNIHIFGRDRKTGYNWVNWANRLLGQRINIMGNYGISGYTSLEYLSKDPASLGKVAAQDAIDQGFTNNIDAAFATKAKWAMIYGFINDLYQTADASRLTTNFWEDRIKPFVDSWIASGRKIIMVTDCGSQAGWHTRNSIDAITIYNNKLRQYCAGNPNALLFDFASIMVDPATTGTAWAIKPNFSDDGIHLTQMTGGYITGKAFAEFIGPLLAPMPPSVVVSGTEVRGTTGNSPQMFSNPLWLTTTGGTGGTGATGTIPAGITGITNSTGVTVAVSTAAGDFGNDLVLNLAATAAGTCQLLFDISATNSDVPNDVLFASMVADVVAGAVNLSGIELYIQSNYDNVNTTRTDGYVQPAGGSGAMLGVEYKNLTFKTPNIKVTGAVRKWLTMRVIVTFAGAGSATVKLRRLGLFKNVA